MTTSPELTGYQIFVSYPRGGHAHAWANRIQAHFESLGAVVWRDEASIDEGDPDWPGHIDRALRRTDLVLAVIGEDSSVCRWQQRELLLADKTNRAVLLLRIADVDLPFCVQEKQPVERRASDPATLDALADAARTLLGGVNRTAPDEAVAAARIPVPQRRAELDYLDALVHNQFSDREARYVPLEGTERRSLSMERALKSVRIETHALWQAFGVGAEPVREEARRYDDVLDAYRDLGTRSVRRLAVLGEPGAGKSFSLERIAVEYARAALASVDAPVPLLIPLGRWTRAEMSLPALIEHVLPGVGGLLARLLEQGRLVLLLDAVNEIPTGQRSRKAGQIKALAGDERIAAVIASCREKDFAELALPFDTLSLQPLNPPQIRDFLHRVLGVHHGRDASAEAERLFWRIAGGADAESAYRKWAAAGAEALFWCADELPFRDPSFYLRASAGEYAVWPPLRIDSRSLLRLYAAWPPLRADPRSLLRLAGNPYLLQIMAALPELPHNRAQLFRGFLTVLHAREGDTRARRNDLPGTPDLEDWFATLAVLAEQLQRLSGAEADDDGARTTLLRRHWPAALDAMMLDFSRDASVLELTGDELRFSHQLLQEYLASQVLCEASRSGDRSAHDFWPAEAWWQRSGWEVVAEIAAESCAGDVTARNGLLDWLAVANPEVAVAAWRALGEPALPPELLEAIAVRWRPALTDIDTFPDARARAAAGRALALLGLDSRPGVGLNVEGLPDIDWVEIPGPAPFRYQDEFHPGLPCYWIARYPVTVVQFQAFVDAGGYRDNRWWAGLAEHIEAPRPPSWSESNAARTDICWYEAVAYCRWLSEALGLAIRLPSEQEWERSARGPGGMDYPWGGEFRPGYANANKGANGVVLGAASAVGLYPQGASIEGAQDMAGNVFEWCLNEYRRPNRTDPDGKAARVLRGASWGFNPGGCRAASRDYYPPGFRGDFIGFRVCRGSPIEPLATASLCQTIESIDVST